MDLAVTGANPHGKKLKRPDFRARVCVRCGAKLAAAALGGPLDSMHTKHVKAGIISSSPEVMGGTPVFAGTRVPVQTFIEYLEGGDSIDDFLEGFPSVSREQVVAFLEEAKEKVLADVK